MAWQAMKEDKYFAALQRDIQSCQEELNERTTKSIAIRTTIDGIATGFTALMTGGNKKAMQASRDLAGRYLSAINIESETLPPICKQATDKAEALGIDIGGTQR